MAVIVVMVAVAVVAAADLSPDVINGSNSVESSFLSVLSESFLSSDSSLLPSFKNLFFNFCFSGHSMT